MRNADPADRETVSEPTSDRYRFASTYSAWLRAKAGLVDPNLTNPGAEEKLLGCRADLARKLGALPTRNIGRIATKLEVALVELADCDPKSPALILIAGAIGDVRSLAYWAPSDDEGEGEEVL